MKQIVFIDIGAGLKGAHNTGFLDLLCKYSRTQEAYITIITHQALSKEWQDKLSNKNISFFKVFNTDIFELSIESSTPIEINNYILQLAQEYKSALKVLIDFYPNDKVQLVFHTMSWEHLMALGLAIHNVNNKRFIFNIFLMYWCGVNENLQYGDRNLALNYRVALKRLTKYKNIKLYTSNQEYLLAFKKLMADKTHIDIHPFFLGDWFTSGINQKQDSSKSEILLYSGEVKKEKGFYNLPDILTEIRKRWHKNNHMVIHLSKNNLNKDQNRVIMYLKKLSPSIEIITKFLNTEDILSLYDQCNLVVLNYDSTAYKNKTSGVMWLAVQTGTTCIVSENTWMHRELLALNVDHITIDESQALTLVNSNKSIKSKEYLQKIYQPFWQWITGL